MDYVFFKIVCLYWCGSRVLKEKYYFRYDNFDRFGVFILKFFNVFFVEIYCLFIRNLFVSFDCLFIKMCVCIFIYLYI